MQMIYVASDLHGYDLNSFRSHLSSIGFNDNDWLYILGDVIDRGQDGVKYLNWLLEQGNVELLLGNHEAMLLGCTFVFDKLDDAVVNLDTNQMKKLSTWMANGADATIRDLKLMLANNPEQLEYILDYLRDECPLYETVTTDSGEFVLTHSGLGNFSPEKKLSEYTKKELLWNRPAPTDTYFKNAKVVLGHTPTAMYGEKFKGKIIKTSTWIDIDVGCAAGMKPAILRLDDMKEFYF